MADASGTLSDGKWKVPGYTGYVKGLQEVYGKTPVMAQVECQQPGQGSFIYTRTMSPPKSAPSRDPCNYAENFQSHAEPDNLWPRQQERAVQDSFKPPQSNIALGDERIDPFRTSYAATYDAPFPAHERLRSPMRNKDLEKTETSLVEHYASSYNRVGDKRLRKMIMTMRERLQAKLGNSNDNAFKMRRLFKMYDRQGSGMIQFEDLRAALESFGMQLDDDSLLALYHVYDPQGSGYLAYEPLVAQLLDGDYFALYTGDVDNSQATVEAKVNMQLQESLKHKLRGSAEEVRRMFAALDTAGAGFLCEKDFLTGCAALGVVLTGRELEYAMSTVHRDEEGRIHYQDFCDVFTS